MPVEYLLFFAVVFGVNLMPAFGPPTWSLIVFVGLNFQMPLPAIVLIGALAAASGRYVLARGARLFGRVLSDKTRRNLAAARAAFERRKRSGILALGLFALSPVPSAQLFEAVGLAGVRLLPFTLAFFAGRLVSYSIYAGSAKALQASSVGEVFRQSVSGPVAIAVQVVLLAGLVALARIDWEKVLRPKPDETERDRD
jgi:uncharacterized membrane protein YdjX (TVP38/TMEM64 family)